MHIKLGFQCRIQRKLEGNVFSRGSNLPSLIPANVYWFISFSCIRYSFEQNTWKVIVYLRNLSESNHFLFFIFIFGDISLDGHNAWTLPLSVWIRPWFHLYWGHISCQCSRVSPFKYRIFFGFCNIIMKVLLL